MKIVITCDSFKGSLTSKQVCQSISNAIHNVSKFIETASYPMADGGEGTTQILNDLLKGTLIDFDCVDEFGNKIKTQYSIYENTAILDVASCIGIEKYVQDRTFKMNPNQGNSYGVGLLMKDAINSGCKTIIIGLGGSCTNDGGMGILKAFGAKFIDKNNYEVRPCLDTINDVKYIDTKSLSIPKNIKIVTLCDVKNTLLGINGATYTFGKQKGIDPLNFKNIDRKLEKYCKLVKTALNIDIQYSIGSGAAGGIGATLNGIFHAQPKEGVQAIIELSNIKKNIATCDLVITGEGKTDSQTINGKVPYGIAKLANEYNKPVIIISGALEPGFENLYTLPNIIGIYSTINGIITLEDAIKNADQSLERTAYSIIKTIFKMLD